MLMRLHFWVHFGEGGRIKNSRYWVWNFCGLEYLFVYYLHVSVTKISLLTPVFSVHILSVPDPFFSNVKNCILQSLLSTFSVTVLFQSSLFSISAFTTDIFVVSSHMGKRICQFLGNIYFPLTSQFTSLSASFTSVGISESVFSLSLFSSIT